MPMALCTRFINKKLFWKIPLGALAVGTALFFAQKPLLEFYRRLAPYIDPSYQADKALVLPYFDEGFYRRTYAADLQESAQDAIDHFLQHSGRLGGGDYDPNGWFNVTLYKERLWPCKGNAFVDFLRQPPLHVASHAQPVEIYANEREFFRAWMAVEGFMRLNRHKVTLVLGGSFKDKIPVQFEPMVKRGLTVQFLDDPHLTFYKSPFLKNPGTYGATDLPLVQNAPPDQMITRYCRFPGYEYLMHRLYNYTSWKERGIINPCMLNFAHYCFEPIEFSAFGRNEADFKKSMQRLAAGFDLMLLNSDIGTPNLRIVPGYMFSYVDPHEIPAEKAYEISFLLSLGGKGMSSFKTRGSFIYHYRKVIWDNENRFPLPTKFYISRRDMGKYPSALKGRVLPTDSKQWIFGSQFTIAIENSKQKHYFSEKLLGCFIALSIPIYIGCPNINDYFDERGMFIAEDPEDVVRIANSLTPETYQKMLPWLIENKRRAEKYIQIENSYIDEFYDKFMA